MGLAPQHTWHCLFTASLCFCSVNLQSCFYPRLKNISMVFQFLSVNSLGGAVKAEWIFWFMWLVLPYNSALVLLFSLAVTLVHCLFSRDVSLSDVSPAAYTYSSFLEFLTSSYILFKTVSVCMSQKRGKERLVNLGLGFFSFLFF